MTTPSSSSSARTILGTLIAFLVLAGSVEAAITPTSAPIVKGSNGNYTWTYPVKLDASGTATAKVPGGACSGGLHGSICTGTFFTIYDFAGYIAGSAKLPPGWKVIVQTSGYTPSTQRPTDSAKLPNLTFYYAGPDITGPADLGNFSVGSSFGDSSGGVFSFQALKNGGTADSDITAIDVPVVKNRSISACITGKCGPPPPSCSLTLVKSADVTSYTAPGTLITYSYAVKNTGGASLDITLTDNRLGAISCPNNALNAGASETCTATYQTVDNDVTAGSISNTATVNGTGACSAKAVSSLTISVPGVAGMTMVKTASAASYSAPGTLITYSYLVTNSGNEDLTNITVTDPQIGLSAVSCPSGTLAQTASETCSATYTTTQADVDAGSISNTGTASGTPSSGPAVTAVSSLTIPAIATPSASLVKTGMPTVYSAPNTTINYSYLVTNDGNVDLSAVSVTDPQIGLSAVNCLSTTLAPGISETCTATYSTTQADVDAGSISNTGTVNATTPLNQVINDTSSLTIQASDAPAISVVKSALPTSYSAPNTTITYSYVVTNTGNEDLSSVSVQDSNLGAISCPNAQLAPMASETCTAVYSTTQADVDAGKIASTATANGTPQTGSTATATSTLTVNGVLNPAIRLVKSSNVTQYSAAGLPITYSYVVTNTGNVTLTVSVTDPQTGLSSITCPSSSLAPGVAETCTATYTTTQNDVNSGVITNTGVANGTPQVGSAVTDSSTLTITLAAAPAISLVKTASVTSYSAVGTSITYSYQVTNTGNVTLTAISVTDPQVGLSAISCGSASLAPGAFETCTATYRTTQADLDAGSISSTGTAHGTPPTGPAVTSTSLLTIPASDSPSIAISMSAGPNTYTVNATTITYFYQVTNLGNVDLYSVSVSDPQLPFSSVTCPNAPTTPLAPHASETCSATYITTHADNSAGSVSQTATAQGTPKVGSAVTATTTLTVPEVAITLVKTANVASYSAAGTQITYSYFVTNAGGVALTVSVTDSQSGLSAITCPGTSLAALTSETCTATYTTTQADVIAGSIANTGTATGASPIALPVTAVSSVTIPLAAAPAISLVKSATPTSYSTVGTTINYSYLVTNKGNVTLAAVSVTDPQVSAVNCPNPSLAPGASETCTATYTTTQADVDAGSISNTGTASGTPPTGPAVTATSSLTIYASDTPALTLVKSASANSYSAPGTLITYSYLVTNTGNVDLTAVSVTDPQPGLSAVNCPSGTLAPTAVETCTATYSTTQADVDAGSLSNTGTASGTPPTGPMVTAVSSLTILAADTPAVSVVKSASVTSYSAPGIPITYSYLVTNTGNVDLAAVSVTDPQPGLSAVSCPGASLAPAASETCTASYTTTQSDLDAGSISNTGTASGTPPTGRAVTATSSLTIPASAAPSVSVVKTASVANYSAPGVAITYSYKVTNTGNVDLTAVSVTDPQPGLSAIGCPSPSLAPGASETCTATYSTTQSDVDAGSISNIGTASGTPQSGPAVTATSSLTIPAIDTPALTLAKSASVTSYSATGTPITYSYKLTNTGNVDLTAVSVTDPQPGLSAISCPSSTLAPAATETCTATYTTTNADITAGSITNTASASGKSPAGGSVTSNSSSVTIPAATVSVTVATSTSGPTISVDGVSYMGSQNFTWTVGSQHTLATTSPQTPAAGTQYTFANWSDGGAISHPVTASAGTTSYTASFNTSYLLTTGVSPSGGGTVSPVSGVYYAAGTPAPLLATANAGYKFANWTGPVASGSSASTTVTMSGPESVTANFVVNNVGVTINTSPAGLSVVVDGGAPQAAPVSVTWQVGSQHTIATTSPQSLAAGTQYTFANWSDGGAISHPVTASAGTTSYTASFNTSYLLTTGVSPSGSGTVSPVSGAYYAAGTPVPLLATAATGYKFANWTGPVVSASSASTTVTMSGPENVTANFVANNVGVTINTSPAGLPVSVDGGALHAAPVVVTWQVGSPHTIATSSPQTPIAGTRYTFASWSDGGAISHSVTASAGTLAYNASFSTSYLLTTGLSPTGGGTVSPVSGSYYAPGTLVPLVATPSAGYIFSSWTGSVANANSASTNVTMTGPEGVTANFISALTVSPSPSYNFGTVYLGSLTTENFTVTNKGTTPISLSGPLLSIVKGGDSNEFVEVNECPKSLAGGSHCTISVTFIAGPFYTPQTATLSIMDNAPGSPQTVTLSATVINPQASFNPGSLSFGNQTINTSVTKTITLKNTGVTALSIAGMTVTGAGASEFTLTPASNCGSSLTAGGSCTVSVTFKPVAKVSYPATLIVTDNAWPGTQTVPLSGTGH